MEPAPCLAATCRARGLEVIQSPIEGVELGPDEKFDVVVSFELIEYLFDPKKFLNGMIRLMNSGGLILIVCPNRKGFDIDTLEQLSDTVDHEHLNYFNT